MQKNLDTSAWAFKAGFCSYGMSTKILCADPSYIKEKDSVDPDPTAPTDRAF